jgi:hypothetical protein
MSKTPISITLRANEWEEIAITLDFAAAEFAEKGWLNSQAFAEKFAKIIHTTVSERN